MDDTSLIIGFLMGIFVGIPIGWIVAQAIAGSKPSSVIFDRNQEGQITSIHYVPGVSK